MNYAHYEQKIIEPFGVALDGWPLDGQVCNPGDIGCKDAAALRDALERGVCKWITLTPEEVCARKIYNRQSNSGQQVDVPPLEPQPHDDDDIGMDEDTTWVISSSGVIAPWSGLLAWPLLLWYNHLVYHLLRIRITVYKHPTSKCEIELMLRPDTMERGGVDLACDSHSTAGRCVMCE